MWRSLPALAVLSGLAIGQELSPGPPPQLHSSNSDGYGLQAMQNALRSMGASKDKDYGSISGLNLAPGNPRGPIRLEPLQLARMELAQIAPNTCAIPLLTVPVNTAIDPQIAYQVDSGAINIDNMPKPAVMPVCRK